MCSSSVPLCVLVLPIIASTTTMLYVDTVHLHPVRYHHIVVSFHFLLDVPREMRSKDGCVAQAVGHEML